MEDSKTVEKLREMNKTRARTITALEGMLRDKGATIEQLRSANASAEATVLEYRKLVQNLFCNK